MVGIRLLLSHVVKHMIHTFHLCTLMVKLLHCMQIDEKLYAYFDAIKKGVDFKIIKM